MSAPFLDLSNLSVTCGSRMLLKNTSLTLMPGQTLALVGESGSGKSLTVLSLLGLLPVACQLQSGYLKLGEEEFDLKHMNSNTWRMIRYQYISMAFQEASISLNPLMRIGVQIKEAFKIRYGYAPKQDQVFSILEELGLPDPKCCYSSYPFQLSGGMQQRAMIAMALIVRPKVLVLDEPTTALDERSKQDLLKRIAQYQARYQMALLLVTHDLKSVLKHANWVTVMQEGEVVEQVSAQNLEKKAQHHYTQQLLATKIKFSSVVCSKDSDIVLKVNKLNLFLPKKRRLLSFNAFQDKRVALLKDVSFSLKAGESLVILGKSGSGKSSLLNTISGLGMPFPSRCISFPSLKIKKSAYRYQKARYIQMIFQDPLSSLSPRMNIGQVLQEGIVATGGLTTGDGHNLEEYCRSLLREVSLPDDILHRYPHQFSGGQRQRIAIARALSVMPSIVLCDEPTAKLDVSIQMKILKMLRQLQVKRKIAYIFVTHDLEVAQYMADRMAIVHAGALKIVDRSLKESEILSLID